jgi:hypothetical protein
MFVRIQELEQHAQENGYKLPSSDEQCSSDSLLAAMLQQSGSNTSSEAARPEQQLQQQPQPQQQSRLHLQQHHHNRIAGDQADNKMSPARSASEPGTRRHSVPPQIKTETPSEALLTSSLTSAPLLTLSPPEFQGYSVDTGISENAFGLVTQDEFNQTFQNVQQQQPNTFPIIQLGQDGNTMITLVQCDAGSSSFGGQNVFQVVKEEPSDQTIGQGGF